MSQRVTFNRLNSPINEFDAMPMEESQLISIFRVQFRSVSRFVCVAPRCALIGYSVLSKLRAPLSLCRTAANESYLADDKQKWWRKSAQPRSVESGVRKMWRCAEPHMTSIWYSFVRTVQLSVWNSVHINANAPENPSPATTATTRKPNATETKRKANIIRRRIILADFMLWIFNQMIRSWACVCVCDAINSR